MTDKDRYGRAAVYCAEMAVKAANIEIRQLWLAVERSYRFLLDRVDRIEAESGPTRASDA